MQQVVDGEEAHPGVEEPKRGRGTRKRAAQPRAAKKPERRGAARREDGAPSVRERRAPASRPANRRGLQRRGREDGPTTA